MASKKWLKYEHFLLTEYFISLYNVGPVVKLSLTSVYKSMLSCQDVVR